jgi:hypothetical protein
MSAILENIETPQAVDGAGNEFILASMTEVPDRGGRWEAILHQLAESGAQ